HHQERSQRDQQHPAGHFHSVQVAPEAPIKLQETFHSQRGEQKRNRQAHGIDGQQRNSLDHRILRRRQPQNQRQDRSHARRPAKGEGEANDERAPRAASPFHLVHAFI